MDMSLAVPFFVLILGCLLADVVVGGRHGGIAERAVGALAWGPGLAAGILSLGSFFALALGFGKMGAGAFLAITLVPVAWAAVVGHRKRSAAPSPVSRRVHRSGFNLQWPAALGFLALATLAVGYCWTFGRWLEHRPLGSYDGMGIWTYRALQWFRSGDAFPETVGLLLESKPGYPLLVPGSISSQFSIWGAESAAIAVATGWFFVLGLAAVTYLAVSRWAAQWVALAAVALVASTPRVWRWAFAQSADLPLAYLTRASAVGLTDLVCRSPRGRRIVGDGSGGFAGGAGRTVSPWLTGFFLGLMVWTKNEGMVFSIVLVAVFAVGAGIRRDGFDLRGWVAVVLGSLPGVLATVVFKQFWVATGEIDRYLGPGLVSRITDPARWWEVAAALAGQLTPGSGGALWGGTWLALAGLLVIGVVRRGSGGSREGALFYGIAFLLFLGFDVAAYLTTPEPLAWHLRTSLDRLLLQIVPMAVVAVFIGFSRVLPVSGDVDRV